MNPASVRPCIFTSGHVSANCIAATSTQGRTLRLSPKLRLGVEQRDAPSSLWRRNPQQRSQQRSGLPVSADPSRKGFRKKAGQKEASAAKNTLETAAPVLP